MPYDPNTGLWTPESDSTEERLRGMLTSDSPYLTRARTSGQQYAASRGLLNSSIAATASEAAAIDAALPVASQDAAQTHAKNLSAQSYGQERGLADQRFGFDTQLAEQRFGHETQLSEQRFGHESQLSAQGFEQERVLTEDRFGYESKLSAQGFGQESLLQAQRFSETSQLSAQEAQQQQDLVRLSTDEELRLQEDRQAHEVAITELDTASRERIAAMDVDARERESASKAIVSSQGIYADLWKAVMNNPDIPADVRDAMYEHLAVTQDANLGLVEQLYGIDIDWASPTFIQSEAETDTGDEGEAAEDDDEPSDGGGGQVSGTGDDWWNRDRTDAELP